MTVGDGGINCIGVGASVDSTPGSERHNDVGGSFTGGGGGERGDDKVGTSIGGGTTGRGRATGRNTCDDDSGGTLESLMSDPVGLPGFKKRPETATAEPALTERFNDGC